MERPQSEDSLNKKFEYSIAIIGLAAVIIFYLFSLLSHLEFSNTTTYLIVFFLLLSAGACCVAVLYYSIFIVFYGLRLAEIKLLPNMPVELALGVKTDSELLHSIFNSGIKAMASAITPIYFFLTFLLLIVLAVLGLDTFKLIDMLLGSLGYLGTIVFEIILFTIVVAVVGYYIPFFKFKPDGISPKNIMPAFIFVVSFIIAIIGTYLCGSIAYYLRGYPTLDVGVDKLVYTACDEVAIIKTTAIAFGTPDPEHPLKVTITTPSGKPENSSNIKVDTGTYLSMYSLKGKEPGRYTVVAKTSSSRVKYFILTNSTVCA